MNHVANPLAHAMWLVRQRWHIAGCLDHRRTLLMELRPSLPGSSGKDSPSLKGWGLAVTQANQEFSQVQPFQILRRTTDPLTSGVEGVPDEAKSAFFLAMGAYIENGIHGLWFEPTLPMDGHCPNDLAVTIGQRFHELNVLYNVATDTGSPIENRLAGAMLWIDADWAGMPKVDFLGGPKDWREQGMLGDDLVFVMTPRLKSQDTELTSSCGSQGARVARDRH